jgi:hypothetical protein
MALTITVNDDLTSSTLRTESDGREALLELSEFNDSQEKFANKAAVEAYVNAVAGDDPRWAWKSLIGIVNDDLTSKWYIVNDSGQFEKQCVFHNWNPVELRTFPDKESIQKFAVAELRRNPNYWHPYRTDAEQKVYDTPQEAENVRRKRDELLNKYEWTVNSPDLTDDKKAEWKTYRQALRDLPDQSGFPWEADGMTWPTKPTS